MSLLDYGVCRLNIVPVRLEPDDRSEQVTQLLFGDHYEVLENHASGKWSRIRIFADQYEGWIAQNQFYRISPEFFEYINRSEFKITTDLTSSLLFNKAPVVIVIGSIIPIGSAELFRMEEQFAFNGESKNIGQKRDFEFMRTIAMKYLNTPYQWGGKSPFGIDCSGFAQMVYRITGFNLARDSSQQAQQGRPVSSFEESEPGDLIFFQNEKDQIHHVGIRLTDSKIIHASGRVRIDDLTADGIVHQTRKILTHRFSHARRIFT